MFALRAHPIAKAGLLLIAFRLGGLAARYLVQPAGSLRDRLSLFLPALSAHLGTLLIAISLALVAAKLLPRVPRAVVIAACVAFAVLMIAGQADFTVSAITGAPLTPTVFRTFRGIRVITSNEFLEPLRANLAVTAGGLALFSGLLVLMTSIVRRDRSAGRDRDLSWQRLVLCIGVGILLLWVPAAVPWPVPPLPIEVAFAREYAGLDHTTLRRSEHDAIAQLRDLVGLPPHMGWVSDEYPLVYGRVDPRTPAPLRGDRPDIVVVMIESLRAGELAFVTGARESVTPNLDALASRGIVFPAFTSNGFPSAPSVLSFHCSAWPHRRKEIITDFADRAFDCIPSRLRDFGYDTVYIGADPHFDNQDRWLPRWYSTVVDLTANGIVATDHNIVSRSVEEIRRHDTRSPARPLFAFVSTYSTHYPFRLPDDAGEPAMSVSTDLARRYRQVLRYTDREIGTLVSFLDTRSRRDQTRTIVVGDHGFYTDLRRTSGLPENDNIWTAAIFAGPRASAGRARRIVEPASHVDMLPTILGLVGDDRPSAALGRDVFGAPRRALPAALAVRPGGLRFDRGGYAIMVDARAPNLATRLVPFPGLLTPGAPDVVADVDAVRLTGWVTAWSYLIEKNRVWNPSFLAEPGDRSIPDARR